MRETAGKLVLDRILGQALLRQVVLAGVLQFAAQAEAQDVTALHGEKTGTKLGDTTRKTWHQICSTFKM